MLSADRAFEQRGYAATLSNVHRIGRNWTVLGNSFNLCLLYLWGLQTYLVASVQKAAEATLLQMVEAEGLQSEK